jgi:formylglycine-generating enzyme required for sulfatase activity
LSAFAYHLTIIKGHFAATSADEDVQAIAQLLGNSLFNESINEKYVKQGLQCLSALNGPLRHDVLEGDNKAAGFLQFRNRSLQEFLAGLWMSRWLADEQLDLLQTRLPLSYNESSQKWYWTFRFAAEMPLYSLDPQENFYGRSETAWLRSMATVFCRGDGTSSGTRRSSELIVRAFPTLQEYVHAGNPGAVALLNGWRGEFQTILDRGDPTALEFTQSFVKIPGGTLKMGSPQMDRERYENEPEELPIKLDSFSISQLPMLNGYYRLFDPGHGLGARDRESPWVGRYSEVRPGPRHPVVDVSWWDAKAASLWFRWQPSDRWRHSKRYSLVRRLVRLFSAWHGNPDVTSDSNSAWYETFLPNESQFEWVAKDGADSYSRYPWGEAFSKTHCVPRNGRGTLPLPMLSQVSVHPRSTRRWQIVDIVGHVWQWCDNVYVDEVKTAADCERTEGGPSRAYRGGGWRRSAGGCRSAYRDWDSPGGRGGSLGFRLALVPSRES